MTKRSHTPDAKAQMERLRIRVAIADEKEKAAMHKDKAKTLQEKLKRTH